MLDLIPVRKNKVNLSDYDFKQDIDDRMRIADFSAFEHQVLQEIFFSPLKFSLKKLVRSLDCKEEDVKEIVSKLSDAHLFSVQNDTVTVDKEMRKYFEFQLKRFDPEFKPDMEFLQGILKKVPIHLLTLWYAIPRTSNNIFESIVEKYLLTPQIFQRYLAELNFSDPKIPKIIRDLFNAPDFKISSSDLIAKYNLSRKAFEEIMLLLEFHFVCCWTYEKEEDSWVEFVTPFYEWHQYLRFLRDTKSKPIPSHKKIIRKRENDFAFVEDLSAILQFADKNTLSLQNLKTLTEELSPILATEPDDTLYIKQCIEKLLFLQLASRDGDFLKISQEGRKWQKESLQDKALYLYRHPWNRILDIDVEKELIRSFASDSLTKDLEAERKMREAERSIKRAFRGEWVFFDEFLKGVTASFNEENEIRLRRVGKQWKYTTPTFTEEDQTLIRKTVLQWLFEAGMLVPGTCEGRDCFYVTSLGRSFFEE